MSKALLSTDATVLAKTEIEASDGKIVLRNAQDAEPIIERNKRWQSEGQGVGKNYRHVAQLPLVVYFDLQKRGILDDPKKFDAWLNDSDNRFFRVWTGKL